MGAFKGLLTNEDIFKKRKEKKNINARKKNLLRKGYFLLALFFFQTFLDHLFPLREKIGDGAAFQRTVVGRSVLLVRETAIDLLYLHF